MPSEFSPQAGLYTAEQLARIKEQARERARAEADARLRAVSAQATSLASGRGPYAPRLQPEQPPIIQPTSGPVRVSRSAHSSPRSGEYPQVARSSAQREKPAEQLLSEEQLPRPRSKKAVKMFGVVTLLGLGVFGADQSGIFDAEEIIGTVAEVATSKEAPVVSSYGEIQLPTETSAEGLNIENCKRPGSTIATIMVSGEYPLRYQLQTADGVTTPSSPYIGTGQLSTGEGQDPANAKFETNSGYPEMTIHDLGLEIHACQKPNTTAVTQKDGVETINFSNIDFDVELVIPEEYKHSDQDQAYETGLPDGTLYTWPKQTFLTADATYTEASVQAAKEAHVGPDQQAGAFNAAVRAILANATDASSTSDFNQALTYIDQDTATVYDAIKEGLEIRYGMKGDGVIEGFNPILTDKNPALLDATAAPEDSFAVESGEVIVGQYVAPYGKGQGN